jgi:mono/diheme cytochrome c family protein
MHTSALPFCIALLAVSVTACAHVAVDRTASASELRGRTFARQTCAGCHSVERAGLSPDRRAPPFRTFAGRYVGVSLQRKLTEIAETGHYDMPALLVHSDEVDDIVSYVDSLGLAR